jgi:CRISPR/Cas system-associated exonuclease Cas4 (RecB family)
VFRGTIDRIDSEHGVCRVVDYKGGAPSDDYAYQVRFYAWMLRKAGYSTAGEASIGYLEPSVRVEPVDVSAVRLDDIESDARRLEAAASEGVYDAVPGAACEECPFAGLCPRASEARGLH